MFKLSEDQVASLLNQPESGMGYQTVEVELQFGLRKATVYNADLLLWDSESNNMLMESYDQLVKKASSQEARLVKSIRVIQKPRVVSESAFNKLAQTILGKPATEGVQKKTKEKEVFMRFTAYLNDRRITVDKRLLPGTYATTEADSKNVKTGAEAVERYALPDPRPAKYRFRIDPLKDTVYREGIVQPANGHKGGGVEVIFDKGTDKNTVSGPAVLPDK